MARNSGSNNQPLPLHLKDLGKRFGVSRATIYRWRRDGYLPKGDIGPHKRIYSERLVRRIEDSGVIVDAPQRKHVVFGENRSGMSAIATASARRILKAMEGALQ